MSINYDTEAYDVHTEADTEAAITAVAHGRRAAAAVAVQALIRGIIAAVREVDTTHNIAQYINAVTLKVESPGFFHLELDDQGKSTGIDVNALMAALAEECVAGYYKAQRVIQIGETNAPVT